MYSTWILLSKIIQRNNNNNNNNNNAQKYKIIYIYIKYNLCIVCMYEILCR